MRNGRTFFYSYAHTPGHCSDPFMKRRDFMRKETRAVCKKMCYLYYYCSMWHARSQKKLRILKLRWKCTINHNDLRIKKLGLGLQCINIKSIFTVMKTTKIIFYIFVLSKNHKKSKLFQISAIISSQHFSVPNILGVLACKQELGTCAAVYFF